MYLPYLTYMPYTFVEVGKESHKFFRLVTRNLLANSLVNMLMSYNPGQRIACMFSCKYGDVHNRDIFVLDY